MYWPEGKTLAWKYASKPYSGYRSCLEPCFISNPCWFREPRQVSLTWVRGQVSGSKTSAPCQLSQYLPEPTDQSRLKLSISQSPREQFPWGERGGGDGVGNLTTRFILYSDRSSGVEEFECRASLAVSPLVEPAYHRHLQAVDLGISERCC